MKKHAVIFLASLAATTSLAALLYAARRLHISLLTALSEGNPTLSVILTQNQAIARALHQQRRVLYDAHKRISAVSKGV